MQKPIINPAAVQSILIFSYTVVSTDAAPAGLFMTSSITTNGGTVASGVACPSLSYVAPNLSGVLVGLSIYIADKNNQRIRLAGANIITIAGSNSASGYGGGRRACHQCKVQLSE